MQNLVLVIGLVIGLLYCFYSFKDNTGKRVLPKSISDTYYTIKIKLYFHLFIIGIAAPLIITGGLVIQVSAIFLILVQAAPAFRNDPDKTNKEDRIELQIHMLGAIGWGVLSLLAISFVYEFWLYSFIFIFFVVFLFFAYKKKGIHATLIEMLTCLYIYGAQFWRINTIKLSTTYEIYAFVAVNSILITSLIYQAQNKMAIIRQKDKLIAKLHDYIGKI